MFGLEERSSSRRLQLERAGSPLALWNKDTLAANADQNLYGSHPFLMEVRSGSPAPTVSLVQPFVRRSATLAGQCDVPFHREKDEVPLQAVPPLTLPCQLCASGC